MPKKRDYPDSDFDLNCCSDQEEKEQRYSKITYEMRLKLIQLVMQNKTSVIKAANELQIKLSTAKFIVNSYKRKGRVMKRKSQAKMDSITNFSKEDKQQSEKQKSSEIKIESLKQEYPLLGELEKIKQENLSVFVPNQPQYYNNYPMWNWMPYYSPQTY